jgi:large subunit ribosomal protein L9
MAKRVQVVLNSDIIKLGRTGDLVEVAPGYARNYLLPQGFAVRVTPGILKQVERRREEERQRRIDEKQKAESQKTAFATIGALRIAKQAGEGEAIFGTVTNREVAETIQAQAGMEVDHRTIVVPEIDGLGTYEVMVKLHPDVTAMVKIEVIAD